MATNYLPAPNDQLWRDCVLWLTRQGMIRHSHKTNGRDSNIGDLASILRDGVLLCQLLKKIDPTCIDMKEVNLKPTMVQFLCLRNIRLFLKVCKEHFGLKNSDLFKDTMLFDLTHFHKVLCTLSALSQNEKTLTTNIEGFAAQTEETDPEEEEIYQRVKTTRSRYTTTSLMDSMDSMDSDDIYQDLLAVRGTLKKHQTAKSKRDCVINEILDTEKNYVALLCKLTMSFMFPLQDHMNPADHACVFYKIRELYDIHSPFMVELTKIRTDAQVMLSEIFLQFTDSFLIYGGYGANLTKATTLLQDLCDRNMAFNELVIRYEREADGGRFKLKDILVVPMQRILKYHLLLDSLIKETNKNHKDYAELSRAKLAMLDVANYINEEVRDAEHLTVINNLQDTIVEWEYDPEMRLSNYGKLIKDAELRMKDPLDKKIRNRYVFIFDKCILICTQLKGNKFAYRDILNIKEYRIKEINVYTFSLAKIDNKTEFIMYFRTGELKNEITEAIKEAQDNVQPATLSATKHKFKLYTFDEPVKCESCNKYLKGLIFQGYICNKCRIFVHKECICSSVKCTKLKRLPNLPSSMNDHDLLNEKLWYVGEMNRNVAGKKLQNSEMGTFLVRIGNDSYVISLKTSAASVKHMRIYTTSNVPGASNKYYLSRSRYFKSVDELVLYYETCSLKENFERLDENTKLLYPFYQLKVVVLKDFEARDRYQLTVRAGQVLSVTGKDGYKDGYWKGRSENNQGHQKPTSYRFLIEHGSIPTTANDDIK